MISRREFSAAVAGAAAAGPLLNGMAASAANSTSRPRFGSAAIKQVKAGPLNVGYAELGPRRGRPCILLHGWPYDIHSYVDVAPRLAAQGYRVLAPYLRGFGNTSFRSAATMRNGQQAATASDLLGFMDALDIDQAVLGGYDWGGRTATCFNILWPQRVTANVLVSGYLINNLAANQTPLTPEAEHGWWYQFHFATERGKTGYTLNLNAFDKLTWALASPMWKFSDATYQRSAQAFNNPDHVAIVVHNYRWMLGLADGERQHDHLEQILQAEPPIGRPTITIGSEFDGDNIDGHAYRKLFIDPYHHRELRGIGHNVPQEAPQAFTQAIIDADHL
ncbi:alpha/beta hydrolase [Actinoplanes sp. NPDC051343]|uniref:alpha/beta hydrolase n=1 Tax=Actinoplanes sp. NPDC051343 TaxID=3363906 RepID=UPI0037BD23A6